MDNVTGTLDRFHLGVSADGQSCVMVFVDDADRSINCLANYAEFQSFIASLNSIAKEMARRRHAIGSIESREEGGGGFGLPVEVINVASAVFQMDNDGGYIEGALVGDTGEVVGIRMRPEVASQLTREMLMSAPAASGC